MKSLGRLTWKWPGLNTSLPTMAENGDNCLHKIILYPVKMDPLSSYTESIGAHKSNLVLWLARESRVN